MGDIVIDLEMLDYKIQSMDVALELARTSLGVDLNQIEEFTQLKSYYIERRRLVNWLMSWITIILMVEGLVQPLFVD